MRKKISKDDNEKIIINFIKQNPKTTYKEIREKTKLHPERIFKKGLEQAFKKAKISLPRTFKIKTKNERKKIIINYIKKHPKSGGHIIAKETKINIANAFHNIEEAYREAGIKYPRIIDKRTKKEKKEKIIKLVKENPLINIAELTKKTKTQPYHFFKNFEEIYREAGIKPILYSRKRTKKKQLRIIKFIKENSLATQREINKNCHTHVQSIFNKGIFEAYEKAGIQFPFERLKIYGIGIKEIRDRAKTFEEEIATKLSGFGKVNRLVKTKRGFADIILERKNKKTIIEVKDYKRKDISISQINQLKRYMEDCACTLGILICHKKPKKDKFLIGKNKIFVLTKEELNKIPELIDGRIA